MVEKAGTGPTLCEDCPELLDVRRWAAEAGHYATVEVLERWLKMSPRVKAEIRRRWKDG